MELNDQTVSAEAYAKTEGGVVFVKVSFFGIYLNSINVRESPNYPERGLWVQLPKYPGKAGWQKPISPIERNPNGGLWRLIEHKCQEAAAAYLAADTTPIELTDDFDIEAELDEAIGHL